MLVVQPLAGSAATLPTVGVPSVSVPAAGLPSVTLPSVLTVMPAPVVRPHGHGHDVATGRPLLGLLVLALAPLILIAIHRRGSAVGVRETARPGRQPGVPAPGRPRRLGPNPGDELRDRVLGILSLAAALVLMPCVRRRMLPTLAAGPMADTGGAADRVARVSALTAAAR